MGRRKTKHKIDKKAIIEAFAEMAKHKNIDRDLLQGIVEETLSMIVRKKHGQEANFEIIVNMEKGDVEIYLMRQVVETVEDPITQISIEEAAMYSEETYSEGDEFIEEITLDNISDSFGRRLITLAAQNLNQRIREVEKDNVYNEYATKVGEVIVGEIYQVRRNDLLVMHAKTEMRLPREEQIPNEPYRYKKNQTIKAIVKEVRRGGAGGQPEIILSRACDEFLSRLFELEIPEIFDGIIQIKGIARDPGERAKVAVMSYDDRVDPVGACVGMKGIRIHSIVREVNNENIDLIEYSENDMVYIMRALAPAKVKDIIISRETRSATVVVPDDQVSLAIGKNGQNVRLASKLTGFSIKLLKEGGEDIDLSEFRQELGDSIYQALNEMGITTAREFLDAHPTRLIANIDGLTPDFMLEIRKIMLSEFEEEDKPETLAVIENIKKEYAYGSDSESEDADEDESIDESEDANEDESIDESEAANEDESTDESEELTKDENEL